MLAWRTLTTEEWQYLFAWNSALNGGWGGFDENLPRYELFKRGVTVCGIENCLVIAPDDWDLTAHPLQSSYGTDSSEGNPMTWEQAEAKGLVCLPAAGFRFSSSVGLVGGGIYWSSTASGSDRAYYVSFLSNFVSPGSYDYRNSGYSVRLITECQ